MATDHAHDHENGRSHAAANLVETATSYVDSLSPAQKERSVISYTAGERLFWYYPPLNRRGLPLRDMDQNQRNLAFSLMESTLSEEAYKQARLIIEHELVLGPLEAEEGDVGWDRNPELYYWTVFGEPGGDEPWAFRVEGHHISYQLSIMGDKVISTTPFFFGSNPAEVKKGPKQGLRILSRREDLSFELLDSLDSGQRTKAIVHEKAPWDIYTYNATRPSLPEGEGLPASRMNGTQKEMFMSLISEYVNQVRNDVSKDKMSMIQENGIEDFHFSWHGGTTRADKHYYRIHGGDFIVEFDNFQNDANHIHSVIRDVSNDFALDVMREHRVMYHID